MPPPAGPSNASTSSLAGDRIAPATGSTGYGRIRTSSTCTTAGMTSGGASSPIRASTALDPDRGRRLSPRGAPRLPRRRRGHRPRLQAPQGRPAHGHRPRARRPAAGRCQGVAERFGESREDPERPACRPISCPSEAIYTTTGPDGRYAFRPQDKPRRDRRGPRRRVRRAYARGARRSTDVTVAPWGRIEGVLKIGNQPAPKQKVSAWMVNQGFSGRVDYDTLTDEAGRFVLERVTPGLMSVYRYVDTPDNRGWTPSNPVLVEVSPGQTAPRRGRRHRPPGDRPPPRPPGTLAGRLRAGSRRPVGRQARAPQARRLPRLHVRADLRLVRRLQQDRRRQGLLSGQNESTRSTSTPTAPSGSRTSPPAGTS